MSPCWSHSVTSVAWDVMVKADPSLLEYQLQGWVPEKVMTHRKEKKKKTCWMLLTANSCALQTAGRCSLIFPIVGVALPEKGITLT